MSIINPLSLGISGSLSQGYSYGGSQNTGQSVSNSWSNSGTDAQSAREWSAMQAELAWARDMEAMGYQMAYNSEEAQKQRDWQEYMANTIYTRSVKNMREAGINPILAANMGLSGASVGSGATASLGGIPSAPMAQSFMDSWSASEAMGQSESQGSSWNSSENGLVTALSALSNLIGNALANVTSGANINIALDGLQKITEQNKERYKQDYNNATNAVKNNNYESREYPHEPGRRNANVEEESKLISQIKNFAENLFK